MPRLASCLFACLTCLAAGAPLAQDRTQLPEIGSSAAQLISPAQERAYARQMLGEMRRYGLLLEDPLLSDWLQSIGHRIAARSDRPEQPFTFFFVRSRDINAFATLGGYIGMNAGLVLTAETEDEVAAVLAHEVAHATQRHIVRSVESAQRDSLPILLGMLGVLAAASASDSNSAGDASQAAIAGGLALMQQRQINYTRSNEHEADRVGIQTLARSGYDPLAMASFFGRMQRATRSQGDGMPDFLRTHPVTTTRISEAKDRAEELGKRAGGLPALTDEPINPALPGHVHESLSLAHGPDPLGFALARERLRVLSAQSPTEALAEYRRRERAGDELTEAERYGYALTLLRTGKAERALALLDPLQAKHDDRFWFDLAWAEALERNGQRAEADAAFGRMLDRQPRNRAIAMSYAGVLAERGTREAGLAAQAVLRPVLSESPYDPSLQESFGRACELAGDLPRAAEAFAEAAFLSGRAEDALNQLQRLKQREDIDYVQRARIDARIAEMTPIVLELRERGIRAGDRSRSMAPGAAARTLR
ncbi:beta-barrel assembly-enhancing protease [Pseudomarimonas salicorniae]|uniref:Putative beta-barrel assembly-enhancing protease n=1 Tax=Pseudomarimonas salicorniae TaxID=2933270 RepID=A0ABT0GEY0_9GAMM|nr:M48 family metalloprotease [Lysobacter sp. CAU 1642]MCK7592587.1 M48 family metalloprotease [Lysobacter sp. CAU 1642]